MDDFVYQKTGQKKRKTAGGDAEMKSERKPASKVSMMRHVVPKSDSETESKTFVLELSFSSLSSKALLRGGGGSLDHISSNGSVPKNGGGLSLPGIQGSVLSRRMGKDG